MRALKNIVVLVVFLVFSLPVMADDLWTLHIEQLYPVASEELGGNLAGQAVLEIDGGDGVGFGLSYNLPDKWLLDLTLLRIAFYTDVRVPYPIDDDISSNDLDLDVLSVFVGYNLIPNKRVDLNIGLSLNYIRFSEVKGKTGSSCCGLTLARYDFEAKVALGANLRLEIPIGGAGWLINADIRYLNTELNDKSFQPVLYSAGCGWRF